MNFIKKNLSNILFFGFILFLFTPLGLPTRALLIKGVSYLTTRVFSVKLDEADQINLSNYDWQLTDLNNQKVNLDQFKGEVILINFWATWCPPCIAEMPAFQKLYNDYQNKAIFLFVTQDDENKVREFLLDKKHNIPVYFPVSTRPAEMNSNVLPTTYVMNKQGQIVIDKAGALDWNSNKVRQLLDELIE